MVRVMDRYVETNRASWDERAPAHAASPDYAFSRFIDDQTFLSDVVRFDLPRLGDLAGLKGVHLQCHIGTDTISLARLGAQMTGLDVSPASLTQARLLAERAGPRVEFVEAELYDAVSVLGAEAFDFVFTGIGALCWLPSIRRWADVVAALLTPGGRLFLREGHPMLWALDGERSDGLLAVEYPYFEHEDPIIEEAPGTYVETEASFTHNLIHTWNRGLGEIVSALLEAGLELTMLVEHDSVPWDALPGQMTRIELGEWRLTDRPGRLAHSYTLQAIKPA
jgi:SAM-dependent methyltransferase